MKLSEMPYSRPDMAALENNFGALITAFADAKSADEQMQLIDSINDLRNDFDTNWQLASIRYSIDTTIEANQEEKDWFDSNSPVFQKLVNEYYIVLSNSQYRNELKAEYGVQLFDIAELTAKTISEEILPDLKQENQLVSEYTKLKASAQIDFEGEPRNLSGMVPFAANMDRDVRKRAIQETASFYADNSDEFDRLFDELTHLRNGMAQKQGFNNYVEMGYARMLRTDYNAEMVASYRQQVLDYVVPLATKLRKHQQERLGLDALNYHDEALLFSSGNPKPQGTPEWIEDQGTTMYKEMSPETHEFFQYMRDNELMDLVNRKGKAGGGYCTFLPNTKSPFIFSNFNGTMHDIRVLTHEAGHAFQVYSGRDLRIPEYNWPTYEACEIHSMGMEYLTWPWMNLFFEEDTDKFKYEHVVDAILFLPYGVAVDEFQHFVYDNPNATPAERNAHWRSLERKYLPHRQYEDCDYLEAGGFWQRQSHIYHDPFYYIDYTLAQICAFQFWLKAADNREQAWTDYLRLCKASGTHSFLKLVDLADLKSPFADGCLQGVMSEIENWLDAFDTSKLA